MRAPFEIKTFTHTYLLRPDTIHRVVYNRMNGTLSIVFINPNQEEIMIFLNDRTEDLAGIYETLKTEMLRENKDDL